MTKKIEDMDDDEIEALSPEDLLALQNGPDADEGDEVKDDDDGKKDDAKGDEESKESEEEESEEESAIDPERLRQLAEEDDDDSDIVTDADGNKMVPYARVKEMSKNMRDMRLILRTALGNKPEADTRVEAKADEKAEKLVEYDVKGKMAEYHKLVTDGNEGEAATLLGEIETKRVEMQDQAIRLATAKSDQRFLAELERRDTERDIKRTLVILYREYPFLNNDPKNKDMNEIAILAVNAKAKDLIARGRPVPDALLEAGRSIGKKIKSLSPAAKADEKPDDKKPKTPDGKDARSVAALKRDAQIRQPAVTTAAGKGAGKAAGEEIDWKNISDAELSKLPPEVLERAMSGRSVEER